MILLDTETLTAQREARQKAFMEMLNDEQRLAFNSLRQHREGKETYVNDYDKDADEIIDYMYYLDEISFSKLPAIEAGTVFSIVTRMLLSGKESSDLRLDELKKRSSRTRSQRTKRGWKFFRDAFNKLIEKGDTEAKARYKAGNLIEIENKDRLEKGEKLLGVKKSKDGKTKLRPTRRTLERQLTPKA